MPRMAYKPRPVPREAKRAIKTEAPTDTPVARIGQVAKRQYIGEWMEAQDPPVVAADLWRATGIDKSTISRWVNNPSQIPHDDNLRTLAAFFNLDDPESLMRHPDDDWLTRKFREIADDADARQRMRQILDSAFPSKRA